MGKLRLLLINTCTALFLFIIFKQVLLFIPSLCNLWGRFTEILGKCFSFKVSKHCSLLSLWTGSPLGHTCRRCEERLWEQSNPVGRSLVGKHQESVASPLPYRSFATCLCDPNVSLLGATLKAGIRNPICLSCFNIENEWREKWFTIATTNKHL